MNMARKILAGLVVAGIVLTTIIWGSDIRTRRQIKQVATEALSLVQAGQYDQALTRFHLNKPTRERLDPQVLALLSEKLRKNYWRAECVVFDSSIYAFVVLYLHPEPGSGTGSLDYLSLLYLDEEWKVSPDERSILENAIEWIPG